MRTDPRSGDGEATPTVEDEPVGRWGAFSYPAYRRYWLAAVARVFGLQFRFIGMPWLVVSSEGLDLSPVWLGVVGLSSTLPTIFLTIPAGALADRYDDRNILLLTQVLTGALSLLLAVLILTGGVQLWMVIAISIATGATAALANPAQSSILPRLIDMRAMPSAVALTSTVWNTMRIVGPAGAGLLIALIGIGQAFFVTALGFALSAALIASLRLEPREGAAGGEQTGMLEGLRFILGNRLFFATIGLSFFTSIFGMSYHTLLPVFAEDILVVGAEGFGFMETASGIGGFLGTLAILKVGTGRRAGPTMLGAAGIFGAFIAAFSASRSLELSMALLFCAGFCSSLYLNIGMTLLQVLVPDRLRGRVMGVWSLTWFLQSIGGMPAAAVAEWIGAPLTVTLGALSVSGFAVLLLALSGELRRVELPEPGASPGGAAARAR